MEKLKKWMEKARHSSFHLNLLNRGLWRVIPFNKPHRFRIRRIGDHEIEIGIPYRRSNLNHLKGIHACALATASEYACGLSLISGLESGKYRLIMKKLEMEYHYQGKTACIIKFGISAAELEEKVIIPLQTEDAVFVPCRVETYDTEGNHICTGHTQWQIKRWDKVKTKL